MHRARNYGRLADMCLVRRLSRASEAEDNKKNALSYLIVKT